MKRKPRGPKCPVCQAVMSPKEEGGPPICWHEANHEAILRARAEQLAKAADARRASGKMKGTSPAKRRAAANARASTRKNKGKDNG